MAAPIEDPSALWQQWAQAAADPGVDASIRGLYADLDRKICGRGPVCFASGRCCNFEAYGHRLYVTGLEIAWVGVQNLKSQISNFKSQIRSTEPRDTVQEQSKTPAGGCPFQIGKLCGVHAIRPLGCRVFFCQEGTQQWQQDLYERFLGRLRQMHDERGLEYRYMEWRAGLADMVRLLNRPLPLP